MTPITPQLIEQTLKKCKEHMKARDILQKPRTSDESLIRRFLLRENDTGKRRAA